MFSPRLATLSNLTEGSDLSIAHSNIGGIKKKTKKQKTNLVVNKGKEKKNKKKKLFIRSQ